MSFDPDAYPGEQLASRLPNTPPQSSQARVDAVYAQMTAQADSAAADVKREVDLMTEARVRFAKASLYEQIIEGQLFQSDDQITLEVENEMKTYAEQQLRRLLNIEDEANPTQKLEEEEITVLKMFAAKMLGRPASIPRPNDPPKVIQVRPLAVPVLPPTPVLAAPKRGRGRPPGTGKNQRAQVPQDGQNTRTVPSATNRRPDPVATRPVQPQPQSNRTPSGQVANQVMDHDQKPLPMPSPDEMVAQAAEQGDRGLRAQGLKMRNPDSHVQITPTLIPTQG